MKKVVVLLLLLVILSVYSFSATKIRVGASPIPHAEILNFVKDDLKGKGYELEVVVFNDYVLPNLALANGELDANYFQHVPYLESFTSKRGIKGLVPVFGIHIEPMGFYLKKDLSELSKGDKIALPNDPTNEGRALLLLHNNGLIKLKDPKKLDSTIRDIVENPKGLKFIEVEAGFVPRVYKEDKSVVGAVINTNYALEMGLNPLKDSTFVEGSKSPYVNVVVVREKDKDKDWVKALKEVLLTDKVRKFILEKYKGAVVPVF